jgi:hypothetical protein
MKFKALLLALVCSFSFNLRAQTMDQGMLVGEVGIGLAIYHITITEKVTGYNFSNDDYAGAFVLPVTMDYGISKRFSVGGTFKYSNYIVDSANSETYKSFDLAVRPAFHFVSRDKFNMNLFALVGGSSLFYNSNNAFNVKGHGGGPTFGLGLDMRIFFSSAIGLYLSYNYAAYTYRNFDYADQSGNQIKVDWTGDGTNIGIGLTFKIK